MSEKKLHRRKFLGLMGAGALSMLAPTDLLPLSTLKAQIEPAIVRDIRRTLQAAFRDKEMSLDFRRYSLDGELEFQIQINHEELYPVASAFKAFLVLYYFLNTPKEEWAYTEPNDTIYRVAVYSNNTQTGVALDDIAERVAGDGNPIEKFNDFLLDFIGMEQGLFSWKWPGSPTVGFVDMRFEPTNDREVHVRSLAERIENVSTAADMAKGWDFIITAERNPLWSNNHFRESILATRELLSIPALDYRSPIELALLTGYIGKDGTLPQGTISLGRVINDAGIIPVKDGNYLVSFMSTGEAEYTIQPAIGQVIDSIRRYQNYLNPPTVITAPSEPIHRGQYNYGFARTQQTKLYSAPDVLAPEVTNPVRLNSIFGTRYVMEGSLIRFWPINEEWGRIVKDEHTDDVFSFTDWSFGFEDANWSAWDITSPNEVYIRIADLQVISYERFAPIRLVTDQPEGTSKFILLDVPRRKLTLFEGIIPILKTPIVLNIQQTPRGRFYIHRMFPARNMPHYPGVPYTNFLHDGVNLDDEGYAIHGAPWHLWNQTVNERETLRRFSHGCINVPNWEMQVGDYNLPVDEFVFRWIAGFPNPGKETWYLPGDNTVRVISGNNLYEEVNKYTVFDSLRANGQKWDDVLRALDNKIVDAPDIFFRTTFA